MRGARLRSLCQRGVCSPPTAFAEVTSISFAYACICGPYAPWRTLCQRCLAQADRSALLRLLYETQRRSGLLDEALATAQDLSALAKSSGDEAIHVSALGQIADIYQARGQFEEALRIRREEALPVFEKLGDIRERAVTMTRIADILAAKGRLDETIAIYEREVFPAYRQLGDQQMMAINATYLDRHYLRRGAPGDREPARKLLQGVQAQAEDMRPPVAVAIARMLAELDGAARRSSGPKK